MIKKITTAALLIFFLNVHVSAKIFQFNLYGEMDVKWNEFENSFDKTATKKDSNGQDYFDDRNGFVRGAFKIGLKMWMSKWAFANVEVMKNDTLWASHNRQFIAEKYAMLGQVFGSADTVGTDVWTGMKIGKGYFTVRNLFYNTLSLRVGRQFLSFSQ
ncbi:MAG TPA: hypothetical protein VKS21_11030, partial [Spirochaetota bacterium]|nr:hypothetical protein [Spirochaetota bacterium]